MRYGYIDSDWQVDTQITDSTGEPVADAAVSAVIRLGGENISGVINLDYDATSQKYTGWFGSDLELIERQEYDLIILAVVDGKTSLYKETLTAVYRTIAGLTNAYIGSDWQVQIDITEPDGLEFAADTATAKIIDSAGETVAGSEIDLVYTPGFGYSGWFSKSIDLVERQRYYVAIEAINESRTYYFLHKVVAVYLGDSEESQTPQMTVMNIFRDALAASSALQNLFACNELQAYDKLHIARYAEPIAYPFGLIYTVNTQKNYEDGQYVNSGTVGIGIEWEGSQSEGLNYDRFCQAVDTIIAELADTNILIRGIRVVDGPGKYDDVHNMPDVYVVRFEIDWGLTV